MVSAIAIMADVSVGRQCQLLIQHEGEDTAVWEWMSIALPSVAPLATPLHWTLMVNHEWENQGEPNEIHTTDVDREGEQMLSSSALS